MPIMQKDEKSISRIVRLALTIITAIAFGAFYLFGFRQAWDVNPEYYAPRLTSVLIIFQVFMLLLTLAACLWSIVRALSCHAHGDWKQNGVAVMRNALLIIGGCALLLLLTYILAPEEVLTINGQAFCDRPTLRLAHMFVSTSGILIIIALLAVSASSIYEKYRR